MCGIAGGAGSAALDGATLDRMVRCLRHRGPDDAGWMLWNGTAPAAGRGVAPGHGRVLFGHSRLAIIDLSDGGWQPMSSGDGALWITYNGELYNYIELRRELTALGHDFSVESDTAVLLAAWKQWGAACLPRLTGMYAFALLDVASSTVHLARDPFGIKPLYYSTVDGLVFASEIPALLEHPGVSRRVHPEGLYDYLRWGLTDHGGGTMFADISQVVAGHVMTFDASSGDLRGDDVHWRLEPGTRELSFDTASTELRERFFESVRLHLRSDVPVGTALSGGIDSSAILLASRSIAGSAAELHSFSYMADDPRYDERRWIELAARSAEAELHEVVVGSSDVVHDIDDLVRDQGEPFGSTSIVAQRQVFRAAHEAGVTVLLDGQGADELFAGYRSYLAAQFVSLVRRGRLAAAAHLARRVAGMPGVDLDLRTAVRVLAGIVPAAVRRPLLAASGRRPFPAWLDREWFEDRSVSGRDTVAGGGSSLEGVLESAFSSTSLPALLRYEDRNSMTWSRESRVPFLTQDLVEFVFSLPREYLVGEDGTSKLVFRAALRGVVPDEILDRRDKIGFNTPEDRWLRELSDFVQITLTSDTARSLPFLKVDECVAAWERVRDGRDRLDSRVWRWVNTVRWFEVLDVRP